MFILEPIIFYKMRNNKIILSIMPTYNIYSNKIKIT